MIYSKDESIVGRKLDEEIILVPIRSNIGDMNNIYVLNEVGSRIWELIDGKRDTEEIIKVIRDEFDSPDDVERDVIEFISDLERIGAIRLI